MAPTKQHLNCITKKGTIPLYKFKKIASKRKECGVPVKFFDGGILLSIILYGVYLAYSGIPLLEPLATGQMSPDLFNGRIEIATISTTEWHLVFS